MTANPAAARFLQTLQSGLKYKLFLLKQLPAAYFSGLKLQAATLESCTVSVPYRWSTQNPFRSTYFACLAMAAEMSTGVLAIAHIYGRKPPVSMLVVGMESKFYKKATGLTFFTCSEGAHIQQAVEKAVQTGEGQTIRVQTTGVNKGGEVIAEFWFTWSFKRKG